MALIACILVLGGCLSPWKGDEGTVSISLGSQARSRAAADAQDGFPWPAEASHTITFSGGSGLGPNRSGIKGGETVHFSVAPGLWTITVQAFYETTGPVAEGSRTVDIKPGPNGVITIPMSLKVIFNDDNEKKVGTLPWAINDVAGSSSKDIDIIIDLPAGQSTITLNKGILVEYSDTPQFGGKSVTMRAQKDVTIQRGSNSASESLFTIGQYGILILGGAGSAPITIDGGNKQTTPGRIASAPLITVNNGEFITHEGVTLQNNTNTSTAGISSSGGGVYVGGNGKFYMNGGTIRGNSADKGGGVYVDGEFSITNGIIYGSDGSANENTVTPGASTASAGAALFVDANGGSAQYGNGSPLSTTNNTIHAANGSPVK